MNEQTMKLLDDPEGFVREIVERVSARAAPPVSDILDDKTSQAIREQVLISHKTYLTRREAAKYLGVSERSIAAWAARPPDQNPFPEVRAASEPRARRERIDEWAEREGTRQRLMAVG